MVYSIAKNEQYNSIELTFDGKPDEKTRDALKKAGYRWHGVRRIWYGYTDEKTIRDILTAADSDATETTETTERRTEQKQPTPPPSLWERCDVSTIKKQREGHLPPVKEVAAILRRDLKKRFPEVVFSITSTHNSINATIKASPYGRERIYKDRRTGEPDEYGYYQNSDELDAVQAYCKAYADSYNYDNSDLMTDYFDVHFYGGYFDISGGYIQTAATDYQKADIADFQKRKAEKEAADHAAFLAQCERDEIERKEREAAERIQAQIDAENAEKIERHIKIIDLNEAEQIAVKRLSEYRKVHSLAELEKIKADDEKSGYEPTVLDAVISRKIEFTDAELCAVFGTMFMCDFAFIQGKGGTRTVDERVTDNNYMQLTAEQQETVKWFSCDCVGVYLNGKLQYVIDAQGYSYCRYILALPNDFDETKDTENAAEYQEALRKYTASLPPFYIPASVTEQLQAADLKAGDEVTVLQMNGWIMSIQEYRGKIESIEAGATSTRYGDGAKIVITPTGKRHSETLYTHKGEDFVLYKGILPAIPDSIQYKDCGGGCKLVNYAGAGAHEYIRAAIDYYKTIGYKPAIDLIAR